MKTILAVDNDRGIRLLCERQLFCEDYIMCPVSYDLESLERIYTNREMGLIVLKIKVDPIEDIRVLRRLWAETIDTPGALNWG